MKKLMKRLTCLALTAILLLTLLLSGCGSESSSPSTSSSTQGQSDSSSKPLKIALLLTGNLGDKSFLDSANAGLEMIKQQFGTENKVVEMGSDDTKYESTLADVSDEDWDIIIGSGWQMQEPMQKVAPEHKDKKYILFDSSVDYSKGDYSNVYSILFSQNEASFLAGALAAKVTESNLPLANKDKVIGFLGGQEGPVINDFLVGYIEGAKYVDPSVKVAVSYIGSFSDSAKGKEMAIAQYNQKADIIFTAAGQAGLGTLDAAKSLKKYALGVDSDQYMLFKDSDPDKANLILSSALKRVDNSLVRAIKMVKDGTIKWGSAETLGLKDEAVGLSKNELYNKSVPDNVKTFLDDVEKKIISGEIKVDTAFGMDTSKLNEIINSVKP